VQTPQQLEALLRDLESDRVERKASLAEREKILEAICAFANDLPNHRQEGVLFVGVHDGGACANLPITDDLLKTLADMRSNGNILPFPHMTVEKMTLKALPFDLRPVPGATLADLDMVLFQNTYLPSAVDAEILAANHRTSEEQLRSVRFLDETGCPTVLGLLTIGRNPRSLLPGAYVQFLRVEGNALSAPVKDQKEISGSLVEVMRELDNVLRAHISTRVDVTTQLTEVRSPDYPIVALRQLVGNALMHRSYEGTYAPVRFNWFDDRIELLNPGGPFGQVTRQNFGRPGVTDYRNPHLAEAMKNLGFVQRFGIGISLARSELAKNGNPEPEFQPEDTHLLVIVRRRS
jgi:ATP-dependent DNA helicase RecG